MKINYTSSIEGVDWEQVSNVFRAVRWSYRDPLMLEKAFAASSHVRIALCGEKIVGFGRTVDDGQFYGMIVDLAILPAFQGQGIGKTILAELRDELEGFVFSTLTSAPGKESFYEKQGWLKQTTAFIWPRSEKQKSDHASSA